MCLKKPPVHTGLFSNRNASAQQTFSLRMRCFFASGNFQQSPENVNQKQPFLSSWKEFVKGLWRVLISASWRKFS